MVCALSINDFAIIESLLVAIVSQRAEIFFFFFFFDSGHLSGAASIMIISNVSSEPLADVVVKYEPKF